MSGFSIGSKKKRKEQAEDAVAQSGSSVSQPKYEDVFQSIIDYKLVLVKPSNGWSSSYSPVGSIDCLSY